MYNCIVIYDKSPDGHAYGQGHTFVYALGVQNIPPGAVRAMWIGKDTGGFCYLNGYGPNARPYGVKDGLDLGQYISLITKQVQADDPHFGHRLDVPRTPEPEFVVRAAAAILSEMLIDPSNMTDALVQATRAAVRIWEQLVNKQ